MHTRSQGRSMSATCPLVLLSVSQLPKARSKAARSPSPVPDARKAGAWATGAQTSLKRANWALSILPNVLRSMRIVSHENPRSLQRDQRICCLNVTIYAAILQFTQLIVVVDWGVWAPLQHLRNARKGNYVEYRVMELAHGTSILLNSLCLQRELFGAWDAKNHFCTFSVFFFVGVGRQGFCRGVQCWHFSSIRLYQNLLINADLCRFPNQLMTTFCFSGAWNPVRSWIPRKSMSYRRQADSKHIRCRTDLNLPSLGADVAQKESEREIVA